MYTLLEHKKVVKQIRKAPQDVQKNYLAWKRIAELEGPMGLRWIKGFHDEALKGSWAGYRSSRLNLQWRVIYTSDKDRLVIYVVEVTPHNY